MGWLIASKLGRILIGGGLILGLVIGGYFWIKNHVLTQRNVKDQREIIRRLDKERDVLRDGEIIRRKHEDIIRNPKTNKDLYYECSLNSNTFEEIEKCTKQFGMD